MYASVIGADPIGIALGQTASLFIGTGFNPLHNWREEENTKTRGTAFRSKAHDRQHETHDTS